MMYRLVLLMLALVSLKVPSDFPCPPHFPKPVQTVPNMERDALKITLGRRLFYDPILSADQTISCASCHSSYHAFAHTDHALSHGIQDRMGTRNAPALFNLAWQKNYMWDAAIDNLEMQALAPLAHPDEMGEDLAHVLAKLNAREDYRKAFQTAWAEDSITSYTFLKSLAAFQASLISANSRYDQMRRGESTFTEMESKGYQIFLANCNACHTEPLFTNNGLANNGLLVDSILLDYGRYKITHHAMDSGLFKVPSLRNWAFTKPYMHDGRYRKMNNVLQHYIHGPKNRLPSNSALKSGLHINEMQQVELMAFLKTLNDSSFVFNPNYQFPK
jgi:cytochrome c peroxidase